MKTSPQNVDILVIGGGIAAWSVVAALSKTAYRLALIEKKSLQPKSDQLGWDNKIYALTPGNAKWINQFSGHFTEHDRVTPVQQMSISDAMGKQLEFNAHQHGLSELAFIAESCRITDALKTSTHTRLTFFSEEKIKMLSFEDNAVLVTLENGTSFSSKLIIGADGQNSWTRSQAKIDIGVKKNYSHHGVVANFSCYKPHLKTAYQWFLNDSVLAALPLSGKAFSMVWSTPDPLSLTSLSPEILCEKVQEAMLYELGELKQISECFAFPLKLMRVKNMVSHRVALVGDSAHNIHPLSGHGMNLGIRDAVSLGQILSLQAHQDPGTFSLLRKYERTRKEDIFVFQTMTDILYHVFKQKKLSSISRLGLKTVDQSNLIKQFLIHYATQ